MATLKEYRLGNMLRGYYHLKARTPKEAWRKGCATFNLYLPSRRGRAVILFELRQIPHLYRGGKKTSEYVPILAGLSKHKYRKATV